LAGAAYIISDGLENVKEALDEYQKQIAIKRAEIAEANKATNTEIDGTSSGGLPDVKS